jgi:hypothetical protein
MSLLSRLNRTPDNAPQASPVERIIHYVRTTGCELEDAVYEYRKAGKTVTEAQIGEIKAVFFKERQCLKRSEDSLWYD